MAECEFIPQPLHVYCDTYNCRKHASWQVGNPQGPKAIMVQLCQDCAEKLVASGLKRVAPQLEISRDLNIVSPLKEPDKTDTASTLACPYCGKPYPHDKENNMKMHMARCPQKPK
jgi:protein-arginine kinase activator protein McsA